MHALEQPAPPSVLRLDRLVRRYYGRCKSLPRRALESVFGSQFNAATLEQNLGRQVAKVRVLGQGGQGWTYLVAARFRHFR